MTTPACCTFLKDQRLFTLLIGITDLKQSHVHFSSRKQVLLGRVQQVLWIQRTLSFSSRTALYLPHRAFGLS